MQIRLTYIRIDIRILLYMYMYTLPSSSDDFFFKLAVDILYSNVWFHVRILGYKQIDMRVDLDILVYFRT